MASEGIDLIRLTECEPSLPTWTLLAVGDFCAINRFNNGKLHDGAAIRAIVTEELQTLIAQADISIVNMEGPIRTAFAPIPKSGPAIQMDAAAPAVLRGIGFQVVSLANNHIMDYGAHALHHTIETCLNEGLSVCGAGQCIHEAMKPVERVVANDIRVAIFAFCEREFGVADSWEPGSAWISHPLALKQVADAAHNADVVVVIAHGGVEEVPFSPVQRQVQLRQFIDAGAALVIGHHPHVPQGWEMYQQGMIFYSMGNFLFDYPNGIRYPKTEWGLMIKAHFRGTDLSAVELIPVETRADRRVGRLGAIRNREKCLSYLHRLSSILAEPEDAIPYWQETAIHLWKTRYQHWLQHACAADTLVLDNTIRSHLIGLYRGVKRRLGRRPQFVDRGPLTDIQDGLLLLNTLRNESHRWTLETALSVLYGDEPDRRTPEVQAETSELLEWTEG